jgi:RNA recognition motif-containing protein
MKTREDAEKYLSELHGLNYMGAELRVNWATPTKSAEQGLSVFIGDIGPDVTKEDLTEAFKDPESRITDTRIVMDPISGRTKGYGFVSYTDGAAAARALSKNGEILKGRRIRVNWANTGKESKMMPGQPFMYPPELYGQSVAPMPRPDVTNILLALAQVERLDVSWYMTLSLEIQAGIVRVSHEAPSAKVMWAGNLDKNTTRTFFPSFVLTEELDLAALFAQYGLIEEITMVSPQGYAFIAYYL